MPILSYYRNTQMYMFHTHVTIFVFTVQKVNTNYTIIQRTNHDTGTRSKV